jgi:hypothetical protein
MSDITRYRSVDYSGRDGVYGSGMKELLREMEADLGTPAAGADPQLPSLKAKLDAAKTTLEQSERDLEVAMDEQLTTIANKALDRGDVAGAILIARMSPRSKEQV